MTETEYLENVISRFGPVKGSLHIWLAKMESQRIGKFLPQGGTSSQSHILANQTRVEDARSRRAETAGKIRAFLSETDGMTVKQLVAACEVSKEHVRTVLQMMRNSEEVKVSRGFAGVAWWKLAL